MPKYKLIGKLQSATLNADTSKYTVVVTIDKETYDFAQANSAPHEPIIIILD